MNTTYGLINIGNIWDNVLALRNFTTFRDQGLQTFFNGHFYDSII
jgi:hypothetical protein